eukprot:scaffold14246_cov105-Isochrysis_galbana.AAC.9
MPMRREAAWRRHGLCWMRRRRWKGARQEKRVDHPAAATNHAPRDGYRQPYRIPRRWRPPVQPPLPRRALAVGGRCSSQAWGAAPRQSDSVDTSSTSTARLRPPLHPFRRLARQARCYRATWTRTDRWLKHGPKIHRRAGCNARSPAGASRSGDVSSSASALCGGLHVDRRGFGERAARQGSGVLAAGIRGGGGACASRRSGHNAEEPLESSTPLLISAPLLGWKAWLPPMPPSRQARQLSAGSASLA